jgi:beta-lactamase regulating signal transducer with metallopeptidase domain
LPPNKIEAIATNATPLVLLSLWAVGLVVAIARTVAEWVRTRRVIARSVPADTSATAVVAELAHTLGMTSSAELRFSSDVDSPLIAGIRRPVILVPADRFPRMSPEQQRMVLCHELVHLKRRDVLFSCIPAAAERLFFFHPLSRFAAQEYAFWREAACDAAVMDALQAPARSYGRLLLDLGVSRQQTLAVASAAMSFSTLKRRLVMLDVPSRPSTGARIVSAAAVALALITIAPVKLVARQANERPKPAATTQSTTRSAATASGASSNRTTTTASTRPMRASANRAATASSIATEVTTAGSAAGSGAATSTTSVSSSAVATAGGGDAGSYAFVATTPSSNRSTSHLTATAGGYSTSYTTDSDDAKQDRLEYVLFIDDSHTTMSGSTRDMQRAREFRERGESLLWFRLDGREYIVRDQSVLRDAQELWEPVSRIGAEQGRIGAQQGAIGARQGQYGARQGEIGAEQGLIAAKQGAIAAQYGVLNAREARRLSEGERSEIARERARLDREMRELDREMRELNDRMRNIERPDDDLGRQMSELGKAMSELGREMSAASRKAERDMIRLVERAIESGAARPVR